jgi:chorismate-pyruvate lyase
LISTSPAYADTLATNSSPTWPDGFRTRVEAQAQLQALNAELLSTDSATATLERWCAVHKLTAQPRIVAERVPGVDKPPTPELRRDLGVPDTVPIRYRRVRLLCGATVLSEADNWYVPGRLTSEMNALLNTTNTPFGRAVQALRFQRHIISAKLLWQSSLPLPAHVLEHRAVLTLPDGTPFSEVVETYTRNVVAFPCSCLPEILVVARRPHPLHPIRDAAPEGSLQSPEG